MRIYTAYLKKKLLSPITYISVLGVASGMLSRSWKSGDQLYNRCSGNVRSAYDADRKVDQTRCVYS